MRPGRIGTWCRQRLTLTNEWHAGNIKSGARRACFGSGPMSKGLDLSALDKKTLTEKETHMDWPCWEMDEGVIELTDNAPLPVKGYAGQSNDNVALANRLKEAEERYLREVAERAEHCQRTIASDASRARHEIE